jgi:hypothetical protein
MAGWGDGHPVRHLTPFGWYWLAWALLGFLLPELYWVFANPRNTLSDEWWALERLDMGHPLDFAEWTPLHFILGLILLAFSLWLFAHLVFGFIR